jgi:uncharacterized protein HemX
MDYEANKSSTWLSEEFRDILEGDKAFDMLLERRSVWRDKMMESSQQHGDTEQDFFIYSAVTAASFATTIAFITTAATALPFVLPAALAAGATLYYANKSRNLNYEREDWKNKCETAKIEFQYARENVRDYAMTKIQAQEIGEAVAEHSAAEKSPTHWQDHASQPDAAEKSANIIPIR